jgi:hypothetical protein
MRGMQNGRIMPQLNMKLHRGRLLVRSGSPRWATWAAGGAIMGPAIQAVSAPVGVGRGRWASRGLKLGQGRG